MLISTENTSRLVWVTGREAVADGRTRFHFTSLHSTRRQTDWVEVGPDDRSYGLLMLDVPLFDGRGDPNFVDDFSRARYRQNSWFAESTLP